MKEIQKLARASLNASLNSVLDAELQRCTDLLKDENLIVSANEVQNFAEAEAAYIIEIRNFLKTASNSNEELEEYEFFRWKIFNTNNKN